VKVYWLGFHGKLLHKAQVCHSPWKVKRVEKETGIEALRRNKNC
jgi:hypothetical protein